MDVEDKVNALIEHIVNLDPKVIRDRHISLTHESLEVVRYALTIGAPMAARDTAAGALRYLKDELRGKKCKFPDETTIIREKLEEIATELHIFIIKTLYGENENG